MTQTVETTEKTTVYYDGSCPLCRREIGFYKKRSGADAINWIDVSAVRDEIADDLSCDAAMARFHVRRPDGELVDGGAAFAALWAALPRFRVFGRLFQTRWLRPVIDLAYDLFLKVRPFFQQLAARREPSGTFGKQ